MKGSTPSLAWWAVHVVARPEQEDLIYWRLNGLGCQDVASQVQGESVQLSAYFPLNRVSALDLSALTLQLRQDALQNSWELPQLRWERLENEDWNNSWKAHWQPQSIGDRFIIYPEWLAAAPQPHQLMIRMDPGAAFGTGSHPTTQLCLEALEMRLDGEPAPTIIGDIGCGSGVLAIGAALLGAKQVYAVDTDPDAVTAALHNSQVNGVADRLSVMQGSLEAIPELVDGLVCNILAETIIDMIPSFKLVVKDTGWIILSGILLDQAKIVTETVEANDWIVAALWKRGEWCCLNVRSS